MRLIVLILIIFISNIYLSHACEQDYDCGGDVNLKACKKKVTISGIDIDTLNKRIMFLGHYNEDRYQRLLSIPITGGPVTYEYSIYGDIPYFQGTVGLFKYISGSKQLYINRFESLNNNDTISYYNTNNGTIGYKMGHAKYDDMDFDLINHVTYASHDYNLIKIPFIPTSPKQSIKSAEVIYRGIPLDTQFKRSGDSLYIKMNNNLYLGNINCRNCSISQLEILLNETYTIKGNIEISSTDAYYISQDKKIIYSYPLKALSNTSPRRVLLTTWSTNENDIITDIVYHSNFLYYSYKNSINRVSTLLAPLPESSQKLFDGEKVNGDCICADGFTGTLCLECNTISGNNTILFDDNNKPYCVPLGDPNHLPTICFQHYQCNYPYGICNGFKGQCECQNNFQGIECKECIGTVSWSDDHKVPTCNI